MNFWLPSSIGYRSDIGYRGHLCYKVILISKMSSDSGDVPQQRHPNHEIFETSACEKQFWWRQYSELFYCNSFYWARFDKAVAKRLWILFQSTQATGLMMAFTFFQTTLHLRNRFLHSDKYSKHLIMTRNSMLIEASVSPMLLTMLLLTFGI